MSSRTSETGGSHRALGLWEGLGAHVSERSSEKTLPCKGRAPDCLLGLFVVSYMCGFLPCLPVFVFGAPKGQESTLRHLELGLQL